MTKLEALSLHLSKIAVYRTAFPTQIAQGILDYRQEHLDALVAAGIIRALWKTQGHGPVVYEVIKPEPPHEHIWHVPQQALQNDWISVVCIVNGCDETTRFVVEITPYE